MWRNCKTVFSFLYLSWSQHTHWLVRTVCLRPKIATARFCSWRLEPSGGLWGPGGSKKEQVFCHTVVLTMQMIGKYVCTDLQHGKPAVKANNLSKWGSIFLIDVKGSRFSQYLLVPASFEFLSSYLPNLYFSGLCFSVCELLFPTASVQYTLLKTDY